MVRFLNSVHEFGGKIAIVSNRRVNVQAATESNFRNEEIPFDVMLLRSDDPEKEPRWKMIEDGTTGADLPPLEIIMYFGDNITDFPSLDQTQRFEPPEDFTRFGESYIVLPNPVYGSYAGNPRN